MQRKAKTVVGGVTFLYSALGLAQGSGNPSGAASSASSPVPDPNGTQVPPDPIWFVAGVVVGLIVGYLAGKASGRSQPGAVKVAASS